MADVATLERWSLATPDSAVRLSPAEALWPAPRGLAVAMAASAGLWAVILTAVWLVA
jgi:hypothetical protein